jgi:hypothetical protein
MEQAPENQTPGGPAGRRKRPPAWAIWLITFAISLGVGLVFDHLTSEKILNGAVQAQGEWIAAVESTSPIAVATAYWENLQTAANGRPPGEPRYDFEETRGAGVWTPIVALYSTGESLVRTGGLTALLQLALGALAVAVYNHNRTRGRSIFYDEMMTNILLGPLAIILAASAIGLALWLIMLAALYTLSGITQLAASLAGVCGVGGFCWYCAQKLAEKRVETILTPKF